MNSNLPDGLLDAKVNGLVSNVGWLIMSERD